MISDINKEYGKIKDRHLKKNWLLVVLRKIDDIEDMILLRLYNYRNQRIPLISIIFTNLRVEY